MTQERRVKCLVRRLRTHAEAHEYIANADPEQKQWMNDLYDAADALERAPFWRDVSAELPKEAQEVLFVRDGTVIHGAWEIAARVQRKRHIVAVHARRRRQCHE